MEMITRRTILAAFYAQAPKRVREFGIECGSLPVGKWNAITDVAGVRAGHPTLIGGRNIRTGVTVILPHGGNAGGAGLGRWQLHDRDR